jgi:uncharacterized coiled-coil protein SlyX
MKMSDTQANGADVQNTSPAQTIDQVKELLFGSEQRDLEQRIVELEAELAKTKADFADQVQSIKADANKQVEKERNELSQIMQSIGSLFQSAGQDISKLSK